MNNIEKYEIDRKHLKIGRIYFKTVAQMEIIQQKSDAEIKIRNSEILQISIKSINKSKK